MFWYTVSGAALAWDLRGGSIWHPPLTAGVALARDLLLIHSQGVCCLYECRCDEVLEAWAAVWSFFAARAVARCPDILRP